MEKFTFGTLPKKHIEVTDEGKIVITAKLSGNTEFKVSRIDTLFYKQATMMEAGYLYASFGGERVDEPLMEKKGFMYYKKSQEDVDRFIELIESLNPEVAVVADNRSHVKQKKEKKQKTNRNAMKCPKCKSINVTFMDNKKKGFSVGKAVAGGALTGGFGAIAGFAGKSGKDRWHCTDCGNVFEKKR